MQMIRFGPRVNYIQSNIVYIRWYKFAVRVETYEISALCRRNWDGSDQVSSHMANTTRQRPYPSVFPSSPPSRASSITTASPRLRCRLSVDLSICLPVSLSLSPFDLFLPLSLSLSLPLPSPTSKWN